MLLRAFIHLSLGAALLSLAGSELRADETPAPSPAKAVAATAEPADFAKDVQPLMESYCFKCHGNGKKKGGLALDKWSTPDAAAQDQKTWKHVLEALRTGEMPPEDEKQPSLDDREKIMAWIDRAVFAVDPAHPDPGRVTIRRLNRAEYNNTIRDLVGVDFRPADDFPADDSGYGFDNIGDVLSLPPVLFERYLAAAEKVISLAILNDHKPRPEKIEADLFKIEGGPKAGTTADARKIDEREASVSVELPVPGEYQLKVALVSAKIGGEPTKVEWKFNGQPLRAGELHGRKDAKDSIAATVRVEKAGPYPLTLRVANPLPKPETEQGRPVTRVFTVRQIVFTSPPQPVKAPASQLRIFAPGRGQPNLEASARMILASFGQRAFRRPLARAEVERFFWIAKQAEKKGANFEQAVQTALTAILVSPHFLFRGELQPQPDNPKSAALVNEWALAARLSYFLWSTMPDEALSAEAQRGTLRKNLTAQVKRMLADPKAGELVENFAGQWLQLRNLKLVQPDPRAFPNWDQALANAMQRETELLFQTIMREDRSVLEFIGADYTFVNERLARHYRIPGVEGEAFVKVDAPQDRPGGLLGHGSFLTLTSNPTRTSPVKRGKYVLDNLLATPPPPPPPEVPDLDDKNRKELTGTLRQRMEQHRADPSCASCHARMDPIGFGLEHFDGIGARRERDDGAEIDSAGQLASGEAFHGPTELSALLLAKKRPDFLRCCAEKILTYALGRGLEFYDRPAIEKIARSLDKTPNFSNLILEVVNSVPFQKRRGEGDHRKFSDGKITAAAKPSPAEQTPPGISAGWHRHSVP